MKFNLRLKASLPLAVAILFAATPAVTAQTVVTAPTKGHGLELKAENPQVSRWQQMTPAQSDSLRKLARENKSMMFRKVAQSPDPLQKIVAGANKGAAAGTAKAAEGVIDAWNAKLAATKPALAPKKAEAGAVGNSKLTWYGYVPSSTGLTGGVYKFTLGGTPTAELVSTYDFAYYGFGSAIVDGKMYLMRVDSYYWNMGWASGNFSTVDLSTGKFSYYGGLAYADYYNYCGYATTQASDGTVYGQFFNSQTDATNCVWGSRDYSSMTKIADFGPSSKIISVALGITSDGKLYSVGEDGNLYQVSTTDGKETLVGATGIIPYSVNGTLAPSSGEIDPKTNTFYWAAVDASGKAGLYTVDLASGRATLISDWGTLGNMQIEALTGVLPPADDGAPAIATNLSIEFEGGSTTGKIFFTAPSTTYAGEELKDSIDFEVRLATEVLASGKVFPGDEDSVVITVPEGQNTISVITSNAVGKSPIAKISQWIGYDVPAPPTAVTSSVDEETGVATVKWTAPTRVYHSGYKGKFTYNIYDRTGSNAASDTLVGTSDTAQFKLQLPSGPMKAYRYSVETVNGTQTSTSKALTTNRIAWGDPLKPPYSETFKSDDTFAFFKVINNNGDNNTWKRSGGWAASNYSYNKDQDKWLITPLITLTAGHDYVLSYSAACNYSWYKGVKYEVKYGKFDSYLRTAEGLNKVIADTITLDSVADSKPVYYSDTIHVDVSGNYAIGFHSVTPNGTNCGVKIGPISIVKVPLTTTPDSVRNFTVTPASNADYRAQIIFQAPQYDISGKKLVENICWISLLRNGKEIYKFNDVVPGSYIQYSDEGEDIKVGNNTYSVSCYLTDEDYSDAVSRTVYVGVGIPQAVPNAEVVENVADKSLDFSWDKVSSVSSDGHKVKVNEVQYGVFTLTTSYFGGYYRDQLKGATYDLNISIPYDTYVGDPNIENWSVVAANEAGTSENYQLSFVTGKPKPLPYEEHFPSGAPSVYTMFTHTIDHTWGSYGYDQISSDGDGKCIDVFAYADTITFQPVVSMITSPKFDLTTAEHPALVYDVNEEVSKGDGTHIAGVVSAGPVIKELVPQAIDVKLENGFKRYKVSLDNYKDNTGLSFGIGARFTGKNNKYSWVDFDNVHLLDLRPNNLGVRSVTPQASVKAGNTAKIDFVIENVGENTASNYIVKAEADGEVFYTDTVSESLPLFAQKEFSVSLPTTIYDESHDIAIKVSVALNGDELASNDTALATIPLLASPYQVPEDVAGSQQGKDVALTWRAPASDATMLTEDFDDQAIFKPYDVGGVSDSTLVGGFGGWTLVNVDKSVTAGPGVNIPYNFAVKSFQVINTDTLGAGAESVFPSRSGAQSLVSFASQKGTTDHWLISPELTGDEQTATIYYRQLDNTYGNDSYQVLASTGSLDTDSFTTVKTVSVQGKEYQSVKVTLPEGTKYFAVRHTYGTYGLQLDDISFTVGSGAPVGYNVYLDGELLKSLKVADVAASSEGVMTFVNSNAADGTTHQYAVSAVYNGGESRPVPVLIETTGISAITLAPGEKVDVYTLDGRIVRRQAADFSGLASGVYVVKNQKVVIK